ncbi:hypothetical protein RhiXN_05812 [Rhizoctonia solani]|uniref:Transmembrane protein n=1 Tax=Rhizoctonia solani TaxID=456999 RepID=A0A8H8NXR1_9AGAM|nr:uncharacterized protein RhiXN_05812 [Rhizoctonia solani]QRW20823.1 hypothetical protein RhiXN_05812 [Rhizoctonia solani]
MASVICQWFLQAVLLSTQRLLYGNLKDERRLKAYVLGVNVMCMMHTLLRTILAFDYIHGALGQHIAAPGFTLPVMITIETMVIQIYFLFRCWSIMSKRKWAFAPLVMIWILSGVAGVFFAVATDYRPDLVMITLASWVGLSFSLDLIMTTISKHPPFLRLLSTNTFHSNGLPDSTTTRIFDKTEYKAYSRVLMSIWNMLWLAAIPPMLAMMGLIVTMYVVDSKSWAMFIYDILSKLFILSLLIALTGRERAANKLKETTQMELGLAAASSGSSLAPTSLCCGDETKATTGCFIVLLAAVLSVVWHRRQRWRRARPWLTKLRAEAANKIEKERSDIHKETTRSNDIKEAPKDVPKDKASEKERKGKERNIPAETKSDGSSVGKRAKERRRRGRESKPTRTASAALISNSQTRPPANQLNETHAQPSHNSPSSPFLVPLPPSPVLPQRIHPCLLLFCYLQPPLFRLLTTPTTSTSTSPAPTPPAFLTNSNANAKVPSSKLPAFPPASPLPPNLARKPPPLVRKSTPSLTSINTGWLNRKPSFNAERRGSKESEEVEFPTLNHWTTAGKDESSGRPKAGRKPSDAARKDQPGRGRKPSDSKKAGNLSTPESTQIASLKGALEAARLREEEVAEERRTWQKKERELQTQVNQLSHQLHALTVAFATGGGQGYPPYGYGYGTAYDPSQPTTPISKPELPSSEQAPTVDQSHTPKDPLGSVVPPSPAGTTRTPGPAYPTPYPYHPYAQYPLFVPPQPHPQSQMIMASTPMMSPPAQHGNMSPPQASPYLFSAHPWNAIHRGEAPCDPQDVAVQGRDVKARGRRALRAHYPPWCKCRCLGPSPRRLRTLREDYVPIPPPPSGIKREREPETDEALSSSEDESDEDSVIFEDGSVGDSVNLSLHGGDGLRDKGKDLEVAAPVRIRVGEEIM